MIKFISVLRKRPFFVPECLLAGFLFFFLVLSGPRFATSATICGGLAFFFFLIEVITRHMSGYVFAKSKPLIPYLLLLALSFLLIPLVPDTYGRFWNLSTGLIILMITFTITRRCGRTHILEIAFPFIIYCLCFLMLVAPSLVGAEASAEAFIKGNRVNYVASGLGEGGGLLSSHFSVIVGISVFLSTQALLRGGFHLLKLFKFETIYHIGSVILGFYLIVVLSGSRQGLFWLFLAAIFCYAVYTRRKLILGLVFLVPVAVILILATILIFHDTESVKRLMVLFDPVAQSYNSEKSAEHRLMLIKIGFNLWKQSPIWGHGNDAFAVKSGGGIYSHNNYIELLVNFGVIGFLMYYTPLVTAFVISIRRFASTRYDQLKKDYLWVAFCVIAVIVSNFFMPTYYMKHMLMFMGILIGRLYFIMERENFVLAQLNNVSKFNIRL